MPGRTRTRTRTRTRWTLRRRLVFGIVALLATISIVIGVVSVLTLNDTLMRGLDGQLTAATTRSQGVADRPGATPRPVPPGVGEILPISGLQPKSVGAFVRHGVLDAAVLGNDLQTTELSAEQEALLLAVPADGSAHTVDLGGTLGDYRVFFNEKRTGSGFIIGLPLRDVQSTVTQLAIVISVVTLLGIVAALAAGMAIVRLALRPLERVVATATHVAELPLDRGEVALAVRVPDEDSDPSTEVGQVGAAINRMLGHVSSALSAREASETKLRAFVADASHELRTPLASIRGYSELTRRGGHTLPPDVVHALARVESESIRMTSLVEDLLLLARLDDGRGLEQQPVDLSQLLTDAVSDARATGPDHEWALELPAEPVHVLGDSARLHQVVANLLANARVHTPAGTRVEASVSLVDSVGDGAAGGTAAVVRVHDNGPGIEESLMPTVFERFARGDTSRSRAAGSTGLGLAIVSAIVDAHAGRVSVESTPGGTTFTVTIPVAAD